MLIFQLVGLERVLHSRATDHSLMGRMKYVQRRANRFEFRFPLPDDLAGKAVPVPWPQSLASLLNQKTGRLKTEIIRSLQTAEAKAAERRALAHIEGAHRLVDQ